MSLLTKRIALSTALCTTLAGLYSLPVNARAIDPAESSTPPQARTVIESDQNIIVIHETELTDNLNATANQTKEEQPVKAQAPVATTDKYTSPEIARAVETVKNQSLLTRKNGQPEVSDFFMQNASANLIANDYTYALVKGNVQLSDQLLTQLNKLGWEQAGVFSALEGNHLNFGDIAGVVLYNRMQNLYNVVFHGTASNIHGWETNLDNELIAASEIKSEIIGKMRNELIHNLRQEKGILKRFFNGTNSKLNQLVDFVKANMTTDMSIQELLAFKDLLKAKVNEIIPRVANKQDKQTKRTLLESINAVFAVKTELLNSIRDGESLDYKGKAHRGYVLKVASAMPEIVTILRMHAAKNSRIDEARMMNSGQSMAGALTKIFAASFNRVSKEIFGRELNASNNGMLVHALSAAPTADYTFKNNFERTVGLDNIVDQKVDSDIVPVADVASHIPDAVKVVAAKIPIAGKALVGKIESDYAPQIGTPMIDSHADVHARADKHFPGKKPSFFSPLKRAVHNNVELPHYGINLYDNPPTGEDFGREAHFEPALATPMDGRAGYNDMLKRGVNANALFTIKA